MYVKFVTLGWFCLCMFVGKWYFVAIMFYGFLWLFEKVSNNNHQKVQKLWMLGVDVCLSFGFGSSVSLFDMLGILLLSFRFAIYMWLWDGSYNLCGLRGVFVGSEVRVVLWWLWYLCDVKIVFKLAPSIMWSILALMMVFCWGLFVVPLCVLAFVKILKVGKDLYMRKVKLMFIVV